MRSRPKPNAKPGALLGVDADRRANTLGSTIPQPPSSIHPVCEHTRQPSPSQKTQLTASSADGSVYGKKSGRNRVRTRSSSNSAAPNASMVPNEVGERDAAVDGERLDLVEHRRVAGVERLVAVRAPGRDHEDRRLLRLHGADLHRRRVRAQHHLLGLAEVHVERVLHRARRVAGRDVERLEVVPVVLDLGALGDAVAQAHEDVLELALHLGDEVEVPARAAVAAEGEVEPVALRRLRGLGGRELGPAGRRPARATAPLYSADRLARDAACRPGRAP